MASEFNAQSAAARRCLIFYAFTYIYADDRLQSMAQLRLRVIYIKFHRNTFTFRRFPRLQMI